MPCALNKYAACRFIFWLSLALDNCTDPELVKSVSALCPSKVGVMKREVDRGR